MKMKPNYHSKIMIYCGSIAADLYIPFSTSLLFNFELYEFYAISTFKTSSYPISQIDFSVLRKTVGCVDTCYLSMEIKH